MPSESWLQYLAQWLHLDYLKATLTTPYVRIWHVHGLEVQFASPSSIFAWQAFTTSCIVVHVTICNFVLMTNHIDPEAGRLNPSFKVWYGLFVTVLAYILTPCTLWKT